MLNQLSYPCVSGLLCLHDESTPPSSWDDHFFYLAVLPAISFTLVMSFLLIIVIRKLYLFPAFYFSSLSLYLFFFLCFQLPLLLFSLRAGNRGANRLLHTYFLIYKIDLRASLPCCSTGTLHTFPSWNCTSDITSAVWARFSYRAWLVGANAQCRCAAI